MRARLGTVLVVVFLAACLNACQSGPGLDEVGPQFEQDATTVFDYLADQYSADPEANEVVNDGSEDIPCDDGARREFEATFPMMDGEPDSNLDLFANGVFASFNVNDPDYYTISEVGTPDDLGSERTFRATNDDETISFEVRAAGEPGSEVVVTGETTCAST